MTSLKLSISRLSTSTGGPFGTIAVLPDDTRPSRSAAYHVQYTASNCCHHVSAIGLASYTADNS